MSEINGDVQEKRVFIGVPSYGQVEAHALVGLTHASARHAYAVEAATGSLLGLTFNSLLCLCLNGRAKYGWTHFCMHHADVQCPRLWLDVLLDEMELSGADILSVVLPIKDDRGLTSTAFRSKSGIRRLTMKQVCRLPRTFDRENFEGLLDDEHMVINTGLMLVDLSGPWVGRWPLECPFTVSDEIRLNKDGVYEANALPEDWNFSSWATAAGAVVKATTAVRAVHHGRSKFNNWEPWGQWEEDLRDRRRGALPDAAPATV